MIPSQTTRRRSQIDVERYRPGVEEEEEEEGGKGLGEQIRGIRTIGYMIRQGRQDFGANGAAGKLHGFVVALCPMQSQSGRSRSIGPVVSRQQVGCDPKHGERAHGMNDVEKRSDGELDRKDSSDDEIKHE